MVSNDLNYTEILDNAINNPIVAAKNVTGELATESNAISAFIIFIIIIFLGLIILGLAVGGFEYILKGAKKT